VFSSKCFMQIMTYPVRNVEEIEIHKNPFMLVLAREAFSSTKTSEMH